MSAVLTQSETAAQLLFRIPAAAGQAAFPEMLCQLLKALMHEGSLDTANSPDADDAIGVAGVEGGTICGPVD